MPSTVLRLCCAFFSPRKGTGFLSQPDITTYFYNGKTMPTLETASKKLKVIHSAVDLFNLYGFHNTGVDLIAKETKIPKATLYNYFHSKEKLIETCISFQKSRLKEEVLAIVYSHRYPKPSDKLKEIVRLHVDVKSFYHLLFKAIFEIKQLYPTAYRMAFEYRKWLLRELFDLVFSLETNTFHPDANMVLNLIDGLMLQVLSSKSLDERDVVLERFWGRGITKVL